MERHHRVLAEADQRELILGELKACELLIDEAVQSWSCLARRGRTLLGTECGKRPPLITTRRTQAGRQCACSDLPRKVKRLLITLGTRQTRRVPCPSSWRRSASPGPRR